MPEQSVRSPRPFWVKALRMVAVVVATYLAIIGVALLMEDWLVHCPMGADRWSEKPSAMIEDVDMKTADGTPIHAWWYPPLDPTNKEALLYCHGKGGNLSDRGGFTLRLQQHFGGCGVLLFDYPGYGRSGGKLSETGCYASTDAAHRWLTEVKRFPPNAITLLGESLGGGAAVELATRTPCKKLVLVSTYNTLPEAAAHRFWFLPCNWLMRNRFDSASKIGSVRSPILVVHGTSDDTIPFRQGEKLFEAAMEPKKFLRLEGQGHCEYLGPEFSKAVKE